MNLLVQNNCLHSDLGQYSCAIGRKGLTKNKIEGDLKTPVGEFRFKKIFYRADKLGEMVFNLPSQVIRKNSGWCDDPGHKQYNQFIEFPFNSSAEKLYRDDNLYDLFFVINYNTDPIIPSKGSAIFLHVADKEYKSTHGCIAIQKGRMIDLATKLDKASKITIVN